MDRTRLIDVSPQREIISGMEDVLHRRQTYIFRREFNKFTNPTGEYIPSIRDVFEGVPSPDETPVDLGQTKFLNCLFVKLKVGII